MIKVEFERMRYSKDGKTAEHEKVFVEIEPSHDPEVFEQRAYDKLFELHPEWARGQPINELGIGWSSAIIL